MSRESKLAKNTLILSIGTFLPKLAALITLPILTGCLTKTEYGTYDLITVMVSLLLPAATLQVQTAAFRFLIDMRGERGNIKKIVSNIYALILPTSFLTLVILFFCLNKISVGIRLLICAYYFADILVNAARQVARGLSDNLDYSISAIISAVGKMLFALILVRQFRMGLTGAVAALCAASSLSLAYLFFKIKLYRLIDFRLADRATLKELLQYSAPMVPNSMSMWVMNMSDRLVVTSVMGLGANAVYSVANKLPNMLTIAQTNFTMAWQESASIVSKDDDSDAYYTSMFRTIFDLMAGFMGLLIAGSPLLFILLIRGDYSDAYPHIPILFMGMFFYCLSSFLGGIFIAYKKTLSVGFTTMAAAACNLLINLLFIHKIGLYAASGSTLISFLLLFLFRLTSVRSFVKLRCDYMHMGVVLVGMTVMCVLSFLRQPITDIVNLLLGCVFFVLLNRPLISAVCKRIRKKF